MQTRRNKVKATERPTKVQAHSPPAEKRKATREYPKWLVIPLIFVFQHIGERLLDELISKLLQFVPTVIESVARLVCT